MTSITQHLNTPTPRSPGAPPVLLQRSVSFLSALAPRLAVELSLQLFFRPTRVDRPASERHLLSGGVPLRLKNGLAAWSFGQGEPVLLVHGWGGRGAQLGAFVEPLVSAGRQVIVLDGPAHGDSPGRRTNAIHFASALLEVTTELGPLAAVIAHSFGGATTTLALARGLPARKVVLIAPPADVAGVIARFQDAVGLPESLRPAFHARITQLVGRAPEEISFEHTARALERPALLFHDRMDREVPFADALRIEKSWPGLELAATDGLGHRRILKEPSVVRRAVEFLRT